jgi:hypothetical protein
LQTGDDELAERVPQPDCSFFRGKRHLYLRHAAAASVWHDVLEQQTSRDTAEGGRYDSPSYPRSVRSAQGALTQQPLREVNREMEGDGRQSTNHTNGYRKCEQPLRFGRGDFELET